MRNAALVERLPRGPHRLTREEVLSSQRGRLIYASIVVVAELGYQQTTVADIVKRAKVSRRAFYAAFRSKDECFAAGFDMAVAAVEERMNTAIAAAGRLDWWDLVRTTLAAYLEALASEPLIAYALQVQTLAAGPALLAQRARMHTVFAHRMRAVCHLAVECGDIAEPPPSELIDVLIGGIDDRIRHCLQTRSAAALPELTPTLYRASLALLGRPEYTPPASNPAGP
ncbi:TetR/AcrR family transcriptional regulator [Nocardia sp. NPDC051570]|uniref:TetR/AcrR family transcriptional regulator n=1 Tax=Nocardia sp. NPDC051570 TaxID=3364324 RepID=UPI0037A91FF9